jgi:hypothetical protein
LAILPLPHFVATTFLRELPSGTTKPCVFECEYESGETRITAEYVVKFRSGVRGDQTGLMFEVIAAQLAKRLSIPVPDAALIELTPELAGAIPDTNVALRTLSSAGLNFGSRFLFPGYTAWLVSDNVPMAIRQTAVEIFAFDVLIDNTDRRREKPNLLSKVNELFAIDHELAFTFTRLIGGYPESWLDRDLEFFRKEHPLYPGLKGQPIDLRRFKGELASIADEEVDEIFKTVPPEFGTLYLEKISSHLRSGRDHADELVEAVRRILK